MSVILPLYKALSARLKGDATLMALLPGGVHSGVAPQGNTRPFLAIGNPIEEESRTLERYGQDTTIEFDAFSPGGVNTSVQVDTILDRVELLLRTPLTLDNHSPARARKEFRTVLVEPDGTRHGMSRYRVFTLETALA